MENVSESVVLDVETTKLKNITMISYLMYGLGAFFGFPAIIGIIISYVKREDAKGTFLETHIDWQIKSFWIFFLAYSIGLILTFFVIGIFILIPACIWFAYPKSRRKASSFRWRI
jgi:uncharacterized membrane protein